MSIDTIQLVRGNVRLIDQTCLPNRLKYIVCSDVKSLVQAIKRLSVRGAPAIGVAAAFGILLGIKSFRSKTRKSFDRHIIKTANYLASSRPTAVNLFNALQEMKDVLKDNPIASVEDIKILLHKKAMFLFEEDRRICREMGNFGAKLIKDGMNVMTICNAGALATVDYGTALGVFFSAKKEGKDFHIYVCETRPLLQGSRLTAWELMREEIRMTLICDSMSGIVMKEKNINAIFTGADRIASNGDSANKIGTYNLAILAQYHKIPFYIVAPYSTFDFSITSGKDIPIEERSSKEVTYFRSSKTAPDNVSVFNPAFDVTHRNLITGIVTEYGIIHRPNKSTIMKVFGR